MTLAELSLALGGFTGIVLVLRSRGDRRLVPKPLLESLLLIVFGAAVIPTVCVAILHFGTAASVAWRIGSLLLVAVAVVWFGAVVPRLVRTPPPDGSRFLRALILIISGINGIAQTLNVFDFIPSHAFAVMFAGLTWYFAAGSFTFSIILLSEDAA